MIGYADTEADAVRELRRCPSTLRSSTSISRKAPGFGVIESIRSLHAKAPPTIIVLTNYAFPEFETACLERGADYFFDKSTQFGAVKVLLQSIRAPPTTEVFAARACISCIALAGPSSPRPKKRCYFGRLAVHPRWHARCFSNSVAACVRQL